MDSDVLELLSAHIDTPEKLEIMRRVYLLGAAERTAIVFAIAFAVAEIADEISDVVAALVTAGLLEQTPDRVIRLGTRVEKHTFEKLMALYQTDRVAILSAMTSIALARVRTLAARAFVSHFGSKK